MDIAVGSRNPIKLAAVRRAVAEAFSGTVNVVGYEVASGVADQPRGEEIVRGASTRALAARDCANADLGVGIEAGLLDLPGCEQPLQSVVCVVVDRHRCCTVGLGPGFALPDTFVRRIDAGTPLGEIVRGLVPDPAETIEDTGAIGLLTRERRTRLSITQEAVLMALVPRMDAQVRAGAEAPGGSVETRSFDDRAGRPTPRR